MKKIACVIASCLVLSACASAPMKTTDLPASQRAGIDRVLDVKTTYKGVRYIDLVEGTGEGVKSGLRVFVEYTGMLEDGTEFDTNKGDKAFTFRVDSHRVIPGWENGVIGMKEGGKRRLIIPPSLAYGHQGVPGTIPPDATLIFDIDLLKVQP